MRYAMGYLLYLGRLRAFFQGLAIPNPALASVAGEFEILGQFERIHGTGVLAKAAEHAATQVVSEIGKFLAAGMFIARA